MSIDDMIADFRKLEGLDAAIAKAAAPRLETIAKNRAAAGVDPSGAAWKPRKKDGGRALANAAAHVRAEAKGSIVTLVLDGPEYWSQKAAPEGSLPQRKVIPDVGDALPDDMRAELELVTQQTIAEMTGGGR